MHLTHNYCWLLPGIDISYIGAALITHILMSVKHKETSTDIKYFLLYHAIKRRILSLPKLQLLLKKRICSQTKIGDILKKRLCSLGWGVGGGEQSLFLSLSFKSSPYFKNETSENISRLFLCVHKIIPFWLRHWTTLIVKLQETANREGTSKWQTTPTFGIPINTMCIMVLSHIFLIFSWEHWEEIEVARLLIGK